MGAVGYSNNRSTAHLPMWLTGGYSNNRSTAYLLMWGQVGIDNRSTVLMWGQVGIAITGVQYIYLCGGRWV